MDKKEILNKLFESGKIHEKDKNDPNWIAAFELYKPSTGDYHVSMDCGACFAAVLKWLKQ